MFSCGNSSSGSGESNNSSLTRSLTHNDVRYEEKVPKVPKTIAAYRSMVNVNDQKNPALKSGNSNSFSNNGRSQSLMEIGKKENHSKTNSRSFSSNGLLDRKSNNLAKMKGLVIPESNSESSPVSSATKVLTTPPWKNSSENFPKYSPAFKRKPFVVYS